MIDQQHKCDDQQLLEMLHSDSESGTESLDENRTLEHVESCERCQNRLGELAADEGDWQRTVEVLSSNARDLSNTALHIPPFNLQSAAWTDSMAEQLLSPPAHPEMLGRIGRYDVERLIGSGGMGVVFKAYDTELNRPVAVKLLAPYLASSGAARNRFAREARAAAAVVDEHVVSIHNVESDDERPFLVMKYIAGGSLQQRLDREGPLEVCEVLRIGMHTAKGLAAAHAQGLIHRDVKPSNILLDEGVDRALLTDFGLARATDDASLTRSGFHPGTPHYMSPEQVRGEEIDGRSDLFSLGCVLYALCTGHPPFRADTSYAVLRRITDDTPRPIRELNPDIPTWMEQLIMKLLEKSRTDRFDSAEQVADILEDCLAHVQHPTTTPLPEAIAILAPKKSKRTPWFKFIAAAVLGFAMLFAGTIIYLETGEGTIRIETNSQSDIPVVIRQGDKTVKHLTVTQDGANTKLRAGNYIIEVEGNETKFEIEGNEVSLSRRGTWIATISEKDDDAIARPSKTSNKNGDSEQAHSETDNPLIGSWRVTNLITEEGNSKPDTVLTFNDGEATFWERDSIDQRYFYRRLPDNRLYLFPVSETPSAAGSERCKFTMPDPDSLRLDVVQSGDSAGVLVYEFKRITDPTELSGFASEMKDQKQVKAWKILTALGGVLTLTYAEIPGELNRRPKLTIEFQKQSLTKQQITELKSILPDLAKDNQFQVIDFTGTGIDAVTISELQGKFPGIEVISGETPKSLPDPDLGVPQTFEQFKGMEDRNSDLGESIHQPPGYAEAMEASQVAETWLSAALLGDIKAVQRIAVNGSADEKVISELPSIFPTREVVFKEVWIDDHQAAKKAIVISVPMTLNDKPGQHPPGQVVIALSKRADASDNQSPWVVEDVIFERGGLEAARTRFQKDNPRYGTYDMPSPWLGNLPTDTQVHVVSCYEAKDNHPINVKVSATGKPMVVVLNSYFAASWNLHISPDADVRGVILAGYFDQRFSHKAPKKEIPIITSTYHPTWVGITGAERTQRMDNCFYAWSPLEYEGFTKMQTVLKKMTGRRVTTFQSIYTGQEFLIDGQLGTEELTIAKRWQAFVESSDTSSVEFSIIKGHLSRTRINVEYPVPVGHLAKMMSGYGVPELAVEDTENKKVTNEPAQVVINLIIASQQQDIEAVKRYAKGSPASEESVQNVREILGETVPAIQDTWLANHDAIVFTPPLKTSSEKTDGRQLLFTLKQVEGRWLVIDIDLETKQSLLEEIERFKKEHPEAEKKMVAPSALQFRSKLIGRWRRFRSDGKEDRLLLSEDGKFISDTHTFGNPWVSTTGTWTLEGQRLTIKSHSIMITGEGFDPINNKEEVLTIHDIDTKKLITKGASQTDLVTWRRQTKRLEIREVFTGEFKKKGIREAFSPLQEDGMYINSSQDPLITEDDIEAIELTEMAHEAGADKLLILSISLTDAASQRLLAKTSKKDNHSWSNYLVTTFDGKRVALAKVMEPISKKLEVVGLIDRKLAEQIVEHVQNGTSNDSGAFIRPKQQMPTGFQNKQMISVPTPVTIEMVPHYSGKDITTWFAEFRKQVRNGDPASTDEAMLAIKILSQQPANESLVIKELEKLFSESKNELNPETIDETAALIVKMAGRRHQERAIEMLFKLADVREMPTKAAEWEWYGDGASDEYKPVPFKEAGEAIRTWDRTLAKQIAKQMTTSPRRVLICSILMKQMKELSDAEHERHFINRWLQDNADILLPAFSDGLSDPQSLARHHSLFLTWFVRASLHSKDDLAASGQLTRIPEDDELEKRFEKLLLSETDPWVMNWAWMFFQVLSPDNATLNKTRLMWARSSDPEHAEAAMSSMDESPDQAVEVISELMKDPNWGTTEIPLTGHAGQEFTTNRDYAIVILGQTKKNTKLALEVLHNEAKTDNAKRKKLIEHSIETIKKDTEEVEDAALDKRATE